MHPTDSENDSSIESTIENISTSYTNLAGDGHFRDRKNCRDRKRTKSDEMGEKHSYYEIGFMIILP